MKYTQDSERYITLGKRWNCRIETQRKMPHWIKSRVLPVCYMKYVGRTGRALITSFKEHLRTWKNKKNKNFLYQYFQKTGYDTVNDNSTCLACFIWCKVSSQKLNILLNFNGLKKYKYVGKSSSGTRNTKHTPISQAKHTHTHTDTRMPSITHQLVKNTR